MMKMRRESIIFVINAATKQSINMALSGIKNTNTKKRKFFTATNVLRNLQALTAYIHTYKRSMSKNYSLVIYVQRHFLVRKV